MRTDYPPDTIEGAWIAAGCPGLDDEGPTGVSVNMSAKKQMRITTRGVDRRETQLHVDDIGSVRFHLGTPDDPVIVVSPIKSADGIELRIDGGAASHFIVEPLMLNRLRIKAVNTRDGE